jgi:3-hydroxyisobutyrate dehydrogenase-like beta-hydroxyacid dehydrogenase
MTVTAVLGLGRMGTAVAQRLADHLAPDHDLRTWTRSAGGHASPADVVRGADVVMLCLYDAQACRDVLATCLSSVPDTAVVVNTTTVGPDEAAELEALVAAAGPAYLHAPVMGSTPAVARGGLVVLAGGKPPAAAEAVLAHLGEVVVLSDAAEAAALKLVANGVLGDSLVALRRAVARGDALGLPRDAVLDVLGRTVLARFVDGVRRAPGSEGGSRPTTFAAAALAKDLSLLAAAAGTRSDASSAVDLLVADGAVGADDDVAVLAVATQDLDWLEDARLDVSPEVVADPAVLRPLHAYALTHATGDPSHLADAFLPTARVEGHRDGELVSWDLTAFRGLFGGSPAPDEPTRSRRVERVHVSGGVATAVMSLHHGDVDFSDVFVLLRDPASGRWWIANKAYERRSSPRSA